MKFNEFIIEASLADRFRAGMSTTFGTGGKQGFDLSIKVGFIKDLTKEINKEIDTATRAKRQFDLVTFTNNYLQKSGWGAEPEDKAQIQKLAVSSPRDAAKLAEFIYTIGSKNLAARQPAKQQANTIAPSTQQTIAQISKLIGTENNDDLEQIAKAAMTMLYFQNRARYNSLYREIVSGNTAGATKQPEDNPNIVRGTNESKRH